MKSVFWKKTTVMLLLSALILGMCYPMTSVQATTNSLSLAQAKKMALANSDSYGRIKSKISLKEVSYKQAVKSIQLKIKNKTTFRWSPLLSFKFPEKLNFEDESNMVYKPAQLQTEITQLKHDLKDEVYVIYEKTQQIFLKTYTYQEMIAFEEEQLEQLKKTLNKNHGRYLLGLANKTDVENVEKSLQKAEEKLVQDKKSYEIQKEKLSQLINLDVTSGYIFGNPYISSEIPRTVVEELIQYTLEHDQSYYEAKMATQLSLLQLTENYSLLQQQYGSDTKLISSYVQQVKSGQKVDSNAFKLSYDQFLTKIDQPWTGKWKILFIKIPKEWLKGQIDGVRYIEDEPYALYENALEYQDVLSEQKALKQELETTVKDNFEAVVTARSSYLKLKEQCEESKQNIQKEQILNSMGELTFEEYTDSLNQYESLQMEQLEALELYSSVLFSFDRLTCGAVSEYFKSSGISMSGTEGGNSYLVEDEEIQGAKYYITSVIEDNMFEFGIYIPDDFEKSVSHYELWVDDYLIGEKNEYDKTFRHLTLSLTGEERVYVRLYDGEEFIDDCEIDPTAYQGELKIKDYVVKKTEEAKRRVIGSYEVLNRDEMGLLEISLKVNGVEEVFYYSIIDENGNSLISAERKISIANSFTYLRFLENELEKMKIQCYDQRQAKKYTAYFDSLRYEIYVLEE
ncbi:MAG: TolC family protein [Lachnospiraceae bacterium]|nr:TolC family protein [Lachnospiraceae bacterium]